MDIKPEREKAAIYLQQLQFQKYSQVGRLPSHMQVLPESLKDHEKAFVKDLYDKLHGSMAIQSFDKFEKEMLLQLKNAREACPSPFEEPWWYSLLSNMANEIEGVLRNDMHRTCPANYMFGTLPTGQVNAMALPVPSTSFVLILFEDGLFGFANMVCKAVARVFPFHGTQNDHLTFGTSKEECESSIKANPSVVASFFEVLTAYIVGGHPHLAHRYIPEPEYGAVAANLRDAMETFVLAHEFGHLISGHLSTGKRIAAVFGEVNAEQIITNWNDEFEADLFALQILLHVQAKKGFDLSLSFWGIDLFFGCIDVVERAVQLLACGNQYGDDENLSESHPPTKMRRQMLREVLRRSFNDDKASAPIQLADAVNHIIELFWQKCEPVLYKMHCEGVKLSPTWCL